MKSGATPGEKFLRFVAYARKTPLQSAVLMVFAALFLLTAFQLIHEQVAEHQFFFTSTVFAIAIAVVGLFIVRGALR